MPEKDSEKTTRKRAKKKQELANISREELSSVLYSPMGLSFDKAFSRQIFLEEVNVAGCAHVKRIMSYVKKLSVGDRLTLLREPKNEYDELAILVKDPKGHKLGYVPRRCNSVIARLMDAGKVLYAIIDYINDGDGEDNKFDSIIPWNLIVIAIYMED
ncbi:MAG: HIRAN domain-containing protein [Eubacterium sp.]|nr:HIRAN domain-containing protein [Eubacterium sp.]